LKHPSFYLLKLKNSDEQNQTFYAPKPFCCIGVAVKLGY
jgi:hypothetical protein